MIHSYDIHYIDSTGGHQYAEFDSNLARDDMMRHVAEAAADGRQVTLTDWTGVQRTIDPSSIVTFQER